MGGREPTPADGASAEEQLAALASAGSLLDTNGLDYWLFGGWAVDFHLGAITRGHEDIDVAVHLDDALAIGSVLEADGWRHQPSEDDDGGTGYERGRVRLELTFLVEGSDGTVRIPLRSGTALWSEEPLGDETRELDGTRARVVKLELLRRGKSSPRVGCWRARQSQMSVARLASSSAGFWVAVMKRPPCRR